MLVKVVKTSVVGVLVVVLVLVELSSQLVDDSVSDAGVDELLVRDSAGELVGGLIRVSATTGALVVEGLRVVVTGLTLELLVIIVIFG